MGKTEPNDKEEETKASAAGDNGAPDGAEELAAAKSEAAAAQDRYLRAMADLENFRRRVTREKEELRLYGSSKILEDLVPVLDNLSRGLEHAGEAKADLKTLIGGMELVQQQLKSALASHGLVEIVPTGRAFDPHQHEAISHQPSDKVPAEHVTTVVRPGYTLNGRLVRPASVVVSSGPGKG